MASDNTTAEADHVVELTVLDEPLSMADGTPISAEITPLLTKSEKPKINIFTISYPRRKPKEQVTKIYENEVSSLTQTIIWIWGGSRYSGLLCTSLSSIFYFAMEVLAEVFSAQSIPILEMAFTRCIIITILSYLWLRRNEQPIFGQAHVTKLLVFRTLTGILSMMCFIYSIQRLPLSQAVVLSFTTPIMASILSRFILHEKLKISDFGCIAFSFFGVLFIFQDAFTSQGTEGGMTSSRGNQHAYAVIVGVVASVAGGASYCLIRAAAKASDQPVVTVFSFGFLGSAATGICSFALEGVVVPGVYSLAMMLLMAVLAFVAEVCLARGLQLEKTSKVANLYYLQAALVQLWGVGLLRVAAVGPVLGFLVILMSVGSTFYIGPDI